MENFDWSNFDYTNINNINKKMQEIKDFITQARGAHWGNVETEHFTLTAGIPDGPSNMDNEGYKRILHKEIRDINLIMQKHGYISPEKSVSMETDGLLPRLDYLYEARNAFGGTDVNFNLIMKYPRAFKGYTTPTIRFGSYAADGVNTFNLITEEEKLHYKKACVETFNEAENFLKDAFEYMAFLQKVDMEHVNLTFGGANMSTSGLTEDPSVLMSNLESEIIIISQMQEYINEANGYHIKPDSLKTLADILEDISSARLFVDNYEIEREAANSLKAKAELKTNSTISAATHLSVLQKDSARLTSIRETVQGYVEAFRSGKATKARAEAEKKASYYDLRNEHNAQLGDYADPNIAIKMRQASDSVRGFFGEDPAQGTELSEDEAIEKIAEIDATSIALLTVSEDLRDMLTSERSGMLIEQADNGDLEITLIRDAALQKNGKINKKGEYFDKSLLSNTGAVTYVFDPITRQIKSLNYTVGTRMASIKADLEDETWKTTSDAFLGKLESSVGVKLHEIFGQHFWFPTLEAKASVVGGNATIKKQLENGLSVVTNVSASLDAFSITEKPSALVLPSASNKLSAAIDVSVKDKNGYTATVASLSAASEGKKFKDLFKNISTSFSLLLISGKVKTDVKNLSYALNSGQATIGDFKFAGLSFKEKEDGTVVLANAGVADGLTAKSNLTTYATAFLAILRQDSQKISEMITDKKLPESYANLTTPKSISRHIKLDFYNSVFAAAKELKTELSGASKLSKFTKGIKEDGVAKSYASVYGKKDKEEIANVSAKGSFLSSKTNRRIEEILSGVISDSDIPALKEMFDDLSKKDESSSLSNVFRPEKFHDAFAHAQVSNESVRASLVNFENSLLLKRVEILSERIFDENASRMYKDIQKSRLIKVEEVGSEVIREKISAINRSDDLSQVEEIER